MSAMLQNRLRWGLAAMITVCVDLVAYHFSGGAVRVWMRNYGHDVLLPAFLYLLQRADTPAYFNQERYMIAYVAFGCALFEFAQLIGLYDGTFDPADFVAYAAGIAAAVFIDRAIRKSHGPIGASG